jgi:hypothetical protein
MKKLTKPQQKEALKNALEHYKFPKKYFPYSDGSDSSRWAIATEEEHGAIQTHTKYMSYNEFNSFLFGFYAAKTNKFNF